MKAFWPAQVSNPSPVCFRPRKQHGDIYRPCLRALLLVIVFYSFAFASSGITAWNNLTTKPNLDLIEMPDAHWVAAFDADGDGNDECFGWQSELYFVFSGDLRTNMASCWIRNIEGVSAIFGAEDSLRALTLRTLIGDTFRYYLLTCSRWTDSSACLDENKPTLVRSPERIQGHVRGDFTPALSCDVNGDSVSDLIGLVNSGKYALQPRGVRVIDGKDYSPLWERCFGQWPMDPRLLDLDQDGTPEIVVAGNSVSNGSTANGFPDSICYLFAFDLHGRDFWPPIRLGGSLTYARFAPMPNQPKVDRKLVVVTRSFQDDQPQGAMMINARSGQIIARLDHSPGFGSLMILPNTDTNARICAATVDGSILLLDDELGIRRQVTSASEEPFMLRAPMDIDNDSISEIVASRGNAVWLFTATLDSVFVHTFDAPVSGLFPMRCVSGSGCRFIIQVKEHAFSARASRIRKNLAEMVPPVVQGSVASILCLSVIFVFVQRRRYLSFLNVVFNDNSRIIIALDSQTRIFRINEGARKFFGPKAQSLMGKPLSAIDDDNRYAELIAAIRDFSGGRESSAQCELRMLHRGSPREMLLQLTRLGRGRLFTGTDIILTMQDITRVTQEKLYESWDVFWRGLAHDLKKPLAPMRLFLQDLGRRLNDKTVEIDHINARYIEPALQQLDLMTRLINRVPRATDAESAPRSRIGLDEVLTYVVSIKRSTLPEHITLNRSGSLEPAWVNGNRDDLTRVFMELIDNAVKALGTNHKGRITLSCRQDNGDARAVRVEIEDDGGGISTQLLPRIFEPGVTTGGSDHQGLGLFTARRVVTQHGGHIEVRSQEGGGTVFAVILPADGAEVPCE